MTPGQCSSSSFSFRLLIALFIVGITFTAVAQGQVTFFTQPTYSAVNGPIFVADFNGDGFPDILDSEGNLNLGNGNGTFRGGTQVAGTPLAVADFNGDGIPDVLEQGTGTCWCCWEMETEHFKPPSVQTAGRECLPR